jgi:3-oxoadipate enol-lactonase
MSDVIDGFAVGSFGRIHYRGAGAGTPMVLMHGVGSSAHEFEQVIGRLAPEFRVIAWDMPGHGESETPAHELSIGGYADALAKFVRGFGAGPAHLVGTSIGAMIAAEMAARHPADTASVVLVELPLRPALAWRNMWPLVERMFSIPIQAFEDVAPRFRELSPGDFERWNIDRAKAGGEVMMSAMRALRDHSPDLRAIRAPTLLLYGENGPTVEGAGAARAALTRSTLLTMADCGHFPMIDDPTRFATIVGDFARAVARGDNWEEDR